MKNTYTVLKSRKIVETKYNLFIVMAEVVVLSSYRRWQWPFKKTVDSITVWLPLNEFGNILFSFALYCDRPWPAQFSSLEHALKWVEGTGVVYPRDVVFIEDIRTWKHDK